MVSAYHQLYYHFIWGTHKRHKMIDERIGKDLQRLINDKVNEKSQNCAVLVAQVIMSIFW